MIDSTISAISTANGVGGVAIIRISGEQALQVAEKMFKAKGKTQVVNFEPYKMYLGEIDGGSFKDCGLCVFFQAPNSFTGEDVVEFHCHGGINISRGILKQTLKFGCALAGKGEFTKRAFLNGKMSLSSAEGLIDMINGESEAEVKAGYYLYTEKLTSKIVKIQAELTEALAGIDADIDFPEEDLEEPALDDTKLKIDYALDEIDKLLNNYGVGRKVKSGVVVAICGKPNTGKSSILNAMLGYDKAIVSNIAGTTRDAVEDGLEINGIKFNIIDTAGIRESNDYVEKIGIERSNKIIDSADLTLFVIDGNVLSDEDNSIMEKIKDKNKIIVFNKSDLNKGKFEKANICVSAKTGENIDKLKALMFEKTVGNYKGDNAFLVEERHYHALLKAKNALLSAKMNIGDTPLDLLGIDIKTAWDYLGEISGVTANEEIISEIFSKFCVGK